MDFGADKKYYVRQTFYFIFNDQKGTYCGEHSKVNGIQEGNGVFFSENEIIMGVFSNEKLSQEHKSIIINKNSYKLRVNRGCIQSRPNGKKFTFGVQYEPDGASVSGLFF